MKLAGRCACGVVLEWADNDDHLACKGLKRCSDCSSVLERDAFRYGHRECKRCQTERDKARRQTEKYRMQVRLAYRRRAAYVRWRRARNEYARNWMNDQARNGTPYYEQHKALKRKRYAENAAFREQAKAKARARYSAKKAA